MNRNYHEGGAVEIFAIAIFIAVCVVFLTGCDEPASDPCCPGECRPVVDVIAFTATWCAPCKSQKPIIDEVERMGVSVHRIDIDRSPVLSAEYGVGAVPTYVVRVEGVEKSRTNDATEVRRLFRR